MTTPKKKIDRCPACGGEDVDSDLGVNGGVCRQCGLVHNGNRWATDASDSYYKADQTSEPEQESDWQANISIQDATDKQLITFLTMIDTVTDHLNLSTKERNQAADIVTEAWNRNLMHGRDMSGMVAAGVYISCRKSLRPRPITTVAKAVGVEKPTLQNSYRALVDTLEIEVNPSPPKRYIPHISEELNLSESTVEQASEILSNNTTEGNPAGIAAAALYLASGPQSDSLTLYDAGKKAGVTKETVWRKSRELQNPP